MGENVRKRDLTEDSLVDLLVIIHNNFNSKAETERCPKVTS